MKRNDILFLKFQAQLHNLPEEKRRNYINNLVPIISENLVVNPDAWETLSKSQKEEFGSYVWGLETIAQSMGIEVDRTEAPTYDLFSL